MGVDNKCCENDPKKRKDKLALNSLSVQAIYIKAHLYEFAL